MQAVLDPRPYTLDPAVSVFNLRESLESIFTEVRQILTDIKQTADARIKLAACAELRKTVALARATLDLWSWPYGRQCGGHPAYVQVCCPRTSSIPFSQVLRSVPPRVSITLYVRCAGGRQ